MADLHAALTDLAGHLDAPAGDELPRRVAAAIEALPPRRRLTWRTWLAAVVAFVTPTVLLSDAIADRLGVRGVEVRQAPLPPPEVIGDDLDLGRPVPLSVAAAAVDFPLQIPRDLGPPAEVWLDEREGGPAVTFVWDDRTLLTQLPGLVDYIGKVLGEANVEEVRVGDTALWISGPPHVVYHLDRDGAVHVDRSRLAANVLLWSEGGVTYRFETHRGRDDALHLARNLVPARGVGGT